MPGGEIILTPSSLLLHLILESCHALPTNPEIGLFVCLFQERRILTRQPKHEQEHTLKYRGKQFHAIWMMILKLIQKYI